MALVERQETTQLRLKLLLFTKLRPFEHHVEEPSRVPFRLRRKRRREHPERERMTLESHGHTLAGIVGPSDVTTGQQVGPRLRREAIQREKPHPRPEVADEVREGKPARQDDQSLMLRAT